MQFFVGTCFHHLVVAGRRAAHDAEARRPASTATPRCRRCSSSSERRHAATVYARLQPRRRAPRRRRASCASSRSPPPAYGIDAGAAHAGARSPARSSGCAPPTRSAGYGHGHRVGLLLENRPAFLFHWFALNALGVSVVPINADMRSAELELPDRPQRDRRWRSRCRERDGDLRAAASAAGVPLRRRSGPRSPAGMPGGAHAGAARRAQPIGRDTECALLYTSGTTGGPRAACSPTATSCAPASGTRPRRPVHGAPRRRAHHHAAAAEPHERDGVLDDGGDPVAAAAWSSSTASIRSTWWQSVRESRATIVALPRRDAGDAARRAAERRPTASTRVRCGFGAGVDRKNHAPFEERFGFPLIEAWAMTETGAGRLRHGQPRAAPRRHAAASAAPSRSSRCASSTTRAATSPADAPGELLVRAAGADPRRGFFSGYLKDEAATEEAWAGGWFHTGDIVRRDADGDFHFVDRKKNVIRRSGENISAVEVESVLEPASGGAGRGASPRRPTRCAATRCWPASSLREAPMPAPRRALAASIVAPCARAARLLQGAGLRRLRRRAAADAVAEDPARRAARAGARRCPAQPHCIDTRAMKRRGRR